MDDHTVPKCLQQGTSMTKVSASKQKKCIFRLDPDAGQITWESKKDRIVPLEAIREIRSGCDAKNCREQFKVGQECEDRWLTIIYILDGNYKTLHVVAPTKEVFQLWDTTLRKLYAIRQTLMSGLGNFEMREAIWEKQYWKGTDESSDHRLNFEQIEKMCRRLNVHSSTESLSKLFKEADTQNRDYLDYNNFRLFVKLLKRRPEIDKLYRQSCSSNGKFDFSAFEKFMRTIQKSTDSQDVLWCMFSKYASASGQSTPLPPTDSNSTHPLLAPNVSNSQRIPLNSPDLVLTIDTFTSFLLSPENSAFSNKNERVCQDMSRPLSEYYISSSHNTYLVGHQLVGVSTIEGYIRALLHGCRSVELDIYDGETEPVVYHGKTLTSKVSVREICVAIAKYAFVTSPFPVIISAEIHCGQTQQDMIVAIMMEVFGEMLVTAPLEKRPKIENLPSPEDLKGRVLLKAKSLYTSEQESLQDKELVVDAESSTTEVSDTDVLQELESELRKVQEQEVAAVKEIKQEFKMARELIQRVRRHPSLQPSPKNSLLTDKEPTKVKVSFKLAALLVYTVGVKCRGINKKEVYAPEHMFSLSETTANKIVKQNMMDLIKHNRTHLVRIYPKGLRLNSSNYEPHRFWSAGAHLVAINWQTFDLGHLINHAMFQHNGRSGYVLKPLALRTHDKELLSKRTSHVLDLGIISAQQLPRPKDANGREVNDKSAADPFVEVSIHIPDWYCSHSPQTATARPKPSSGPSIPPTASSTPARTVSARTSVVRNNGFNPIWDEQLSLPFDCVGDMMDLIFVRIVVKQEEKVDSEPLGVYCVSLGSLEHGYRHLPLHDSQFSQYLFSTLFVWIAIRDA